MNTVPQTVFGIVRSRQYTSQQIVNIGKQCGQKNKNLKSGLFF